MADPNALPAVPAALGVVNQNTNAVALRTQSVNSAVKNLIIIAAGQSNMVNVAPSTYSPTNGSAIDCMNIRDGAIYAAADPLLGCSGDDTVGNPMLRLADSYITAGNFARVILVPIAINGTTVADWETGFASTRIAVAIRRLSARGIAAGTNVDIVVLWGQGEADNQAGTSRVAYANSLNNVIAASRTAGFAGLWFVARQSYFSGAASANIQNAQGDVVNHGANVWAGPDADALVGNNCSGTACRIADNTHWTNNGSASYAAAWKTAMALYGAPF